MLLIHFHDFVMISVVFVPFFNRGRQRGHQLSSPIADVVIEESANRSEIKAKLVNQKAVK